MSKSRVMMGIFVAACCGTMLCAQDADVVQESQFQAEQSMTESMNETSASIQSSAEDVPNVNESVNIESEMDSADASVEESLNP